MDCQNSVRKVNQDAHQDSSQNGTEGEKIPFGKTMGKVRLHGVQLSEVGQGFTHGAKIGMSEGLTHLLASSAAGPVSVESLEGVI